MTVKIYPSRAQGTVSAPPSKSIAHRALICGALSEGSVIENIELSDDIKATVNALLKMGATAEILNDSVKIGLLDPEAVPDGAEIFCCESGSTLRFLIPQALLSHKKTTFTGAKRLFERPLSVYEDICKDRNLFFQKNEQSITVCGPLKNGDYRVRGDISSQFITGLLFALSLADGDSTLTVTESFESESYVDLTLDVMAEFGVHIKREQNTFYISGNSHYKKTRFVTEGDCSNAAFLDAFNLLGGDVSVTGLAPCTRQGDRVYKRFFEELRKGVKCFDLTDCPDLAPVMFSLAAVFGGAEFYGTARLKLKESDRAAAMAEELLKFGIECRISENSVTVKGGTLTPPTAPLSGHGDHRIVMALTLLCTLTGGTVTGAEAVSKSFPLFFNKIRSLGIKLEQIGD